jgi:hypothetical protein
MDFLKGIDLTHWWNVLIACGLALVVAALAAHERGLILIGLGMISWGFGESSNHKKMIEFMPASAYIPQGILTSYPRLPRPLGLSLDFVGFALILFGIWKLLSS